MTSERQIAANRRNAAKSTGPRSKAGKNRARSNSFRHGLTSHAMYTAGATEQVEELARSIAGTDERALIRDWARTAASAMLGLARLRQIKGVLMAEILSKRSSETEENQRLDNIMQRLNQVPGIEAVRKSRCQYGILYRSPLRTYDDVRRAQKVPLEQLRKLDRYEQLFSARRDKAINKIDPLLE